MSCVGRSPAAASFRLGHDSQMRSEPIVCPGRPAESTSATSRIRPRELKAVGRCQTTNTFSIQHVPMVHSYHSQTGVGRIVRHRYARREKHAHVTAQDEGRSFDPRNGPTMTELAVRSTL